MTILMDIQSQIAALQQQAAAIKAQEFNTIVLEIQQKMEAYDITVADLDGFKGRARKAGNSSQSANPAPAKFRGPNGESWSGRGLMPKWMSALVAQGAKKEDFAITA